MAVDVILSAWQWPGPVHAVRHDVGLINDTWWVRGGSEDLAVLQRLNTSIFVPEVHEDIEAVTTRLAGSGMVTPRLRRTRGGELWHEAADGGVYRCLTLVGDRTISTLTSLSDATEAGHLVARFHAAVRDLSWTFRSVRAGAHDTVAHMDGLRQAVEQHPEHRLHGAVAELADPLLAGWGEWSGPTGLPTRIVHGDLKISNVRFEGPRAVALIDLDTLAHGTIDIELGDALRSWCNPAAEDTETATFELALFEAAMAGYARGGGRSGLTEIEWSSIVPGVERICLELAARFARDALEESYFGWNPALGGRGEHNLLRARGQLSLATSVRAQSTAAAATLARVLGTA